MASSWMSIQNLILAGILPYALLIQLGYGTSLHCAQNFLVTLLVVLGGVVIS